jgi:hypothetical protein
MAMQVIATGAQMEYRTGALLAHILHTGVRAGIAMFQSVSSEDGKRNMILAAAKAQMTDDDATLLEIVFGVNKSARGVRNSYAHHLWGHSDDLLDALLIIDPRDLQAGLTASTAPTTAARSIRSSGS